MLSHSVGSIMDPWYVRNQRPRFVDFPPIEVFLSPYIDLDIGVFHYECTNQFA